MGVGRSDLILTAQPIHQAHAQRSTVLHIHPAVHVEHLTRDIACLIRGEKSNRVSDIEIGPGPLERHVSSIAVLAAH